MYESLLLRGDRALPEMVSYLERHRVIYESPPTKGFEAIPLGNGSQTAMIWHSDRSIEIYLNDCDAYDLAPDGEFRAWSWEGEERQCAQVSVGHISIEEATPAFDRNYLKSYRAELDLGRATMKLHSETPFTTWSVSAFCAREPSVLVVDISIHSAEPLKRCIRLERWGTRSFAHYYEQIVDDPAIRLAGGEAGIRRGCAFVAQSFSRTRIATVVKALGRGLRVCRLHSHGVEIQMPPSRDSQLRLLVAARVGESGDEIIGDAIEAIERAGRDPEGLRARHLQRWTDYWNRSFVMLADADDYLENLYYLHFYSLFCCGLGKLPPNFSGGGWTWNGDTRNWAHLYHWNQQQLLWAVDPAGRPELADNLFAFRTRMLPLAIEDARRLFAAEGAFYSDIANVNGWQAIEPDTLRNFTVGPQIALSMYDHFRFTGDARFLKDCCYPVLAACARFYRAIMQQGEDGHFRISGGATPYESYWNLQETLTDGCGIRDLVEALIAARSALGIAAVDDGQWQEFLGSLPPLPVVTMPDADGREITVFSVGKKWDGGMVEFEEGKYPNSAFPATLLAPVFPFAVVGLKDEGSTLFSIACDTIRLFLDTNVYRQGAYGCSGHTPIPEAAARLGMRTDVLPVLRLFVKRYQRFPNGFMHYSSLEDSHYDEGRGYFTPRVLSGDEKTTRYAELHEKSLGERRPLDSERFLHMYYEPSSNLAAGVQEMLLQSHEDVIRLFPAVPADATAAFRLWARGGFEITSEMQNGRIRYAEIIAHRAGSLRLALPWPGPVTLRGNRRETVTIKYDEGIQTVDLAEGESLLVFPAQEPPEAHYFESFRQVSRQGPKRWGNVTLGKPKDF